MEIGILTYHRSHNYGALLQAIALRQVLLDMGHNVFFIDYWPEYHRNMYSLFSIRQMLRSGKKGAIKYLYKAVTLYTLRKERIKNIESFITEQIEPYCQPYGSNHFYDVVIYGSDQIWRKQRIIRRMFNPVYFGNNIISTSCHISYAASMGIIKLNSADEIFLKKNLLRFKKLSVREEQLKDTLRNIGINSRVVLDPTLLLDKEVWDKLLPIPKPHNDKYILYYRLMEKSFDEEQIIKIAKLMGYKLIILDSTPRKIDKNILSTSDPYDFLSLIKYAELVFTSSYHGLIFSIIFNKNFYASFVTNVGRAESLLSKLNLLNHLIKPNSEIKVNDKIDYIQVNKTLNIIRKESLNFLNTL